MISPILCYGSEIWGTTYCSTIESVQIKFCKSILKVGRSTCNNMVLGECGRVPLQFVYMTKAIKYWCRLLHLSNNRLPKQCYFMLKALDDSGRNTWATKIKNVLYQFGFGYTWISQDVGDIKVFLSLFKQRLHDNLVQSWQSSLQSNRKCFLQSI